MVRLSARMRLTLAYRHSPTKEKEQKYSIERARNIVGGGK